MKALSFAGQFQNDEKFRELVLYVSEKCASDSTFGATKLNKILFFSDFLSYRALGKSITGHPYQKLPYGPAPRLLLPILKQMAEQKVCSLEAREHFGFTQKRVVPHRSANLKVFDAPEIDLVNDVIEALRTGNATEVSNFSHKFPGWLAADMNEDIPYSTVFVGAPRPLTASEIEYGEQLAG